MISIQAKSCRGVLEIAPSAQFSFKFDLAGTCPVQCTGQFDMATLSVHTAFDRNELRQFARALEVMHASPQSGKVEALWSCDGRAVLTLRMTEQGQVRGDFLLSEGAPALAQRLHGRLDLDQSHLPELAAQCDALLAWNDYDRS